MIVQPLDQFFSAAGRGNRVGHTRTASQFLDDIRHGPGDGAVFRIGGALHRVSAEERRAQGAGGRQVGGQQRQAEKAQAQKGSPHAPIIGRSNGATAVDPLWPANSARSAAVAQLSKPAAKKTAGTPRSAPAVWFLSIRITRRGIL